MNSRMNVDGKSKMNSRMNVDGKSKMNSRMNVDRISGLPSNIIDSILSRLTILEAMRTSILSRSWRYKWHSLSKISIDHEDLLTVPRAEHVELVNHVLFVHCGSIDEFKLNINSMTDYDINRWILFLSRHSIKELIINSYFDVPYKLPYCIFSCSSLTKLDLACCAVRPPPAEFKTFNKLRELVLYRVKITGMVLEILINSCPHLLVLELKEVRPRSSLKIDTPNLSTFCIRGTHYPFQFKNLPRLASFELASPVSLSSHIAVSKDCKIAELLGSMPTLQILTLRWFALQHLAVGDIPASLPFVCPVKCLKVCINFVDLQELLAAICIFRSSPLIQHLELMVYGGKPRVPAYGFWEGEEDFNLRFDHLQEVWVQAFNGTKNEVKFIKFLLANAPALKKVNIEFSATKCLKDLFATVTKLAQFPRISPNAQLILPACF